MKDVINSYISYDDKLVCKMLLQSKTIYRRIGVHTPYTLVIKDHNSYFDSDFREMMMHTWHINMMICNYINFRSNPIKIQENWRHN